ncbi:MAG TPA: signal peptidase I [Candidatus Paceibacterota bacterium]
MHARNAMRLFSLKKKPSDLPSETVVETAEHPLAEIVRFSIIAILIVVPIRMFIAQPFIVSGASMEDTFHSGEYLIVDQVSYYFNDPKRGEVIIFRYPRDPSKYFIKRVIGLPGDTIIVEDGRVTIFNTENPDGVTLSEGYAEPTPVAPRVKEVLGDREYFVMGDNRDESSDSRSWGVLQEERIVGRAWLRLFPPQEVDYLPGAAVPEETSITSES